jgi:HEAT repeat protein
LNDGSITFFCPSCWARVKEDDRTCPSCGADIESLDRRTYQEKLTRALTHPERTTRLRAAFLLGEIGDPGAVPFLCRAVAGPEDLFFAEAIAIALGKIGGKEVLPPLIRLMKHPAFIVRGAALISLARSGTSEAMAAVRKAANDPSLFVREKARGILDGIPKKESEGVEGKKKGGSEGSR